ncbi:hypothetical protein ACP4OV_026759 [Aristida adscensionis]
MPTAADVRATPPRLLALDGAVPCRRSPFAGKLQPKSSPSTPIQPEPPSTPRASLPVYRRSPTTDIEESENVGSKYARELKSVFVCVQRELLESQGS